MSMLLKQVGCSIEWKNLIYFFGLKPSHQIFSASEQFSTNIQAVDITVQEAMKGAHLLESHLYSLDTLPQEMVNLLEGDVDVERLKVQLCMLPDLIKTALEGTIKKVTNVRTIADAMVRSEIYQNMLSEANKVLSLYFTFPVTTATAERSFSSLRRIKTYLRSTMSACRLNSLMLMHVHQERTEKLDLAAIAHEFVSVNSRRLNYYGKIRQ